VEHELGAQFVDKETLFREADFVTLHIPLLPQTHHYVSVKELLMMKKTAHLINASRGRSWMRPLSCRPCGASDRRGRSDVYEHEPYMASGLVELDNVTLAPHIASASVETRMKMAVWPPLIW
jgi:lactate dehydrogenase-like 2-hydroxyacid dehydrogenase